MDVETFLNAAFYRFYFVNLLFFILCVKFSFIRLSVILFLSTSGKSIWFAKDSWEDCVVSREKRNAPKLHFFYLEGRCESMSEWVSKHSLNYAMVTILVIFFRLLFLPHSLVHSPFPLALLLGFALKKPHRESILNRTQSLLNTKKKKKTNK